MDRTVTLFVLAVVTFATALNLWLSFRLAAKLRDATAPDLTVPIGQAVPPFEGEAGAATIRSADLGGRPSALVFLSPGCKTCAGKVPELARMLPGAAREGVALWIVPADDYHDIARLVGATPLAEHVLRLDEAARQRLNPLKTVPFYLFLDEALIVRASGYLGDADWTTFAAQMTAAAARLAAAEPGD